MYLWKLCATYTVNLTMYRSGFRRPMFYSKGSPTFTKVNTRHFKSSLLISIPNEISNLTVHSGVLCKRTFHTTNSKQALPPILWLVLRQVLKFAAVLTGRGLRKWWARLPNNKRKYILHKLRENQQKIMIGAALSGGMVYAYYMAHLVEDPITKRKKFLLFSEKQIKQMAMIESEVAIENFKNQIVMSGYTYNHVLQITQRILQANRHLPGANRKWIVIVVDDKSIKNAFVLPSGHIFIYTGMLAAVNDDQLAAIIAHEISHALLNHSAEVASKTHLLEMLILLPLVALWALLPDWVAVSSHYFTEYISAILFKLPFSRSLETEADTLGLEMVARACFDPQEASAFWKKMERLEQDELIELLSTHPSFKTRYETLDGLMPQALRIRTQYCNKSDMDPRLTRSKVSV